MLTPKSLSKLVLKFDSACNRSEGDFWRLTQGEFAVGKVKMVFSYILMDPSCNFSVAGSCLTRKLVSLFIMSFVGESREKRQTGRMSKIKSR